MKKSINILSLAAAFAVLAAMPLSADAAVADANTNDYIHSVQLERYALTAEEAASGDAAIHASVYLRGSTNDSISITSTQCQILADDQIYMRNIYNPSSTYTEGTYSYLGGEFTTAYRPFCFGKVSGGTYNPQTYISIVRDYCMDPIAGKSIYYQGDDTISFKLPGRYYVDEEGNLAQDSVSHVIVCPLTVNPDGSATYSFKYADIYYDHTDVATETGTISYYQPELLNVGDRIPDNNSILSWITADSDVSFLGNSDDFPLLEADAHFKKDTPCGIYDITLNADYCNVSASENGTSCHLPLAYQGAAVAVGVETADMAAGDALPVYACYYAHDTKTITGASTGFDYICDVSYTDGTSESAKNVTGAVNAGTSPDEIMNSTTDNYFIGDIPMYCGDTPLTFNGNETNIKVLIGKKGDVNLDGTVSIDDATSVLTYYAQKAAGLTPDLTADESSFNSTLAFFLGYIDTEFQLMEDAGTLDISDATSILSYYANTAAGNTISWDKFLK